MKLYRQFIRWCRGLGHGRGFGVQSPFAYDFVTTVINQSTPYYAYDVLDSDFSLKDHERKDCRFLFRLANFLQPQTVWVADEVGCSPFSSKDLHRACMAYLQAGCRKATAVEGDRPVDLAVVSAADYQKYAVRLSSKHAVLVVCHIDEADAATPSGDGGTRNWRNLLSRPDVTFSFELYRLCVVFFDSNFHRQNYLVNY